MKKIFAFVLALGAIQASWSQAPVVVTATITGSNGAPYGNGFYTVQLIDASGNVIPPYSVSGSLDSSGHFSISIIPNSAAPQAGTQWKFQICSPAPATSRPSLLTGQVCFTSNQTISSAGDISTALSSTAPAYYFVNTSNGTSYLSGGSAFNPASPGAIGGTTPGSGAFTSITSSTIGLSPSTSPICPNGTGGVFTTSGCALGTFTGGTVANQITVGLQPLTAIPPGSNCIFVGDSITFGYGLTTPSTQNWGAQAVLLPQFANCTYYNFAHTGDTIANQATVYTSSVHPLRPSVTGKPGFVFFLCGTNDLGAASPSTGATAFTALQSYWSGAVTDGFTMIGATLTPRLYPSSFYTATQETQRQILNDLIRSAYGLGNVSYVIDFDQALQDSTSANMFQADQLHPTVQGQGVMALAAAATMAGRANVSAVQNNVNPGSGTAIGNFRCGNQMLIALTTGTYDTACGYNSGNGIITTNFLTAYGALTDPAGTGADVTVSGYKAGFALTSGTDDSFSGYQSGSGVTSGSFDTFGGAQTGLSYTTQSQVTLYGYGAGLQATGSGTTAFGFESCAAASTGAGNTCVGQNAGKNFAAGSSENAVLGDGACGGSNPYFSTVCVGHNALAANNNSTGSVALGENALDALTTGIAVCVGRNCGLSCVSCTGGGFGGGADLGSAVTNAFQIGTGQNTTSNSLQFLTHEIADSTGNLYNQGAIIGLSIPAGTPTYTAGTNVTSVACAASYTCTNTRGEVTIVGGTATTGTIATINFSATLGAAPGMCIVNQNGGGSLFDIGHGVPGTTSFTITAGVTVAASTLNVDYHCIP